MKFYLNGMSLQVNYATGLIQYSDSQTNKIPLQSQFTLISANRKI